MNSYEKELIQIKVVYKKNNEILAEEVIAEIFNNAGFEGVAITDADLDPIEGWEPGIENKVEVNSVSGYMDVEKFSDEIMDYVESKIKNLNEQFSLECSIEKQIIKNEDWAENWKEYFYPEKVGQNIVVKPSWREYSVEEGDVVIELDPGMAFGTGSHPTTAFCINYLEKYLKKNDSFLDIGTGSGILLIAASKLGASKLTGTDNDDLALQASLANLEKNNIDQNSVTLIKSNLIDEITRDTDEKYRVVAANILAEVIILLLDDLHKVIEQDSIMIFSGILEDKIPLVKAKIEEVGFQIIEVGVKDSWAGIVCGKK